MSPLEAIRLLRQSKHFQVIALVISFAAIGAGIIEQQLNMAVAEAIPGKDARTAFLANVIFYSSIAGFIIQMTLTSRLHRLLGIGFALLLMPVTTGATAALMLLIPALWTSTLARVLDTVAALHRRQDDARDPVRAPADEPEVQGQAVCRRRRRPVRQGRRARRSR